MRVLAPTGTDGPAADLVGFSDDDLRVLAQLETLAPALSPSPSARERMRTRVLVGSAVDATADATDTPEAEVDELSARRRGGHGVRGRFLVAAAAALCLVVALSGISLVLSRDALPGDALYSLKRASENTQLELTFGDTDRGLRHLDYAARRVDELGALVEREGGTALGSSSGPVALVALAQVDPSTVTELLGDLDSEAAQGSGLLTAAGVAGDAGALGSLGTWAQGQSARLAALRPQLPAGAQPSLDSSLAVLEQVRGRAAALGSRLGCSPITSGRADDLGPLPATTPCVSTSDPAATTTDVTDPAQPAPTAGVTSGLVAPQGGTGSPTGAGGAPVAPGPSRTATPAPVVTTAPVATTPAPPLPTGVPTVPSVPLPTVAPTISIPLPLLPPITIGPILPGLPPITIGG